ncbi:hypothetical protein [Catenulispora subtropica]|uniref:Uncharacterized protein n=1 Tax=Catenulispora subtropica TaxID=450798 RepID=A0ABP5E4Z2_9ACTN
MEALTSPVWVTQSTAVRDPAAADPAPGPARVLRLLDAARPADVAGVLRAMAPEALAEAVGAIALPLAPAVVAAVLGERPSVAREVLACRLVQQPECVPVRTMGLPEYRRALDDAAADDYRDVTVSRLRTLALDALRSGTLTAGQVVEHTRPAVLTVTLGVCTPEEYVQPGARRATGDVRVLVRGLLAAKLGEDQERWSTMLDASGGFGGTLGELLDACGGPDGSAGSAGSAGPERPDRPDPSGADAPGGFRRFFGSPRTDHNPQSLLLGLAPRDVAGRYLAALHDVPKPVPPGPPQLRWGWLLTSGPLTRPLVDHVLDRGLPAQRRWLARNELCPDSALERAGAGSAQELLLRRVAPPRFRRAAFRAFERDPAQVRTWAQNLAGDRLDQLLDLVWDMTDDPVTLRQVVLAVSGRVTTAALVCAYGALASAVGPEPVWALELQRTGSLEQALPAVRASQLTGTADPLVDAARQVPRRHWLDAVSDQDHRYQALRTDAELDRAGHFPREALVAAHLDGRPERWREVVRRLAGGAAGPVEAVIREVAEAVPERGQVVELAAAGR